jgi:hypothetical protein
MPASVSPPLLAAVLQFGTLAVELLAAVLQFGTLAVELVVNGDYDHAGVGVPPTPGSGAAIRHLRCGTPGSGTAIDIWDSACSAGIVCAVLV